MGSDAIVQHDDGTPAGTPSTIFFIRGILGPDAWSIFMRWLRRLAERFSVAASLVGHLRDGWRFRPGCSIGRPARHGVLAPLPMLTLRCSRPWRRCFRHFYAVNALRNGVGVFEVARNMGTSVQIIQEYYGRQATPAIFATRLGEWP